MRSVSFIRILLAAVGLASAPARAADECSDLLICATRPAEIAQTIQTFGYKAELKTDKGGDPMITSAADGSAFSIYFYDCKDHAACGSIQFRAWYDKDDANSAQLANEWNLTKRFGQMAFDPKDGTLMLNHDVSMVGGLNRPNFGDVFEWWTSILAEANKFFDSHPSKKEGK